MDNNKIKGYKGVMDLDLSTIDPKFHAELKQQHLIDIKEYQQYQLSLPTKLRYENSIAKAFYSHNLARNADRTKAMKQEQAQNEKDKRFIDIHNRVQRFLSEQKVRYSFRGAF